MGSEVSRTPGPRPRPPRPRALLTCGRVARERTAPGAARTPELAALAQLVLLVLPPPALSHGRGRATAPELRSTGTECPAGSEGGRRGGGCGNGPARDSPAARSGLVQRSAALRSPWPGPARPGPASSARSAPPRRAALRPGLAPAGEGSPPPPPHALGSTCGRGGERAARLFLPPRGIPASTGNPFA
ncbi:sterile alpha motif domain-containing protein 1-like [Cavia porcellus]|uniref:sterile alpha motif domain-containing protein 1-like n=1 Tax=Cavia porcellus TaxID=10141 RepID=UPI002FE313AE